ncbi:bactericidal permeability-increasing protein-like [Synchiropus splendidus]|uniref:bactericidal permeability-increasing protein-like n=1 Tax=Synchiropus splendidus TaxID=270530 RepID=UPI00237DFFDC|nr:bactericidal permeability-increasing protein-like [Synchiropus splendidus]
MMFLCCWLFLVALTHITSSTNPGVQVKLTQKGLEYGRQIGMAKIQQKLNTITIPDISGSQRVSPIGKVKYSLTNMHMVDVALPQSSVDLESDVGVRLNIAGASLSMRGNWRVKYLRVIKDSGSFTLSVNGLTITTSIAITRDATGHPEVSVANCAASVSSVRVKFHGGASWLYNLFSRYIDKALRSSLEKKMCPLVADAVSDLNPQLKTLNVIAKVDQFAEIEYSLVSAPPVSSSAISFNLKGEFYNIGRHQEPPFSPVAFSLPPQHDNMLYIGISAFTSNSAGFVYNTAGALSLYITDDMIPQASPFRLNTRTFGTFIPEVAKQYPNMMIKLLVKNEQTPNIILDNNNATVQTVASVTAYAVQSNGTLSPLFILNMDASVSGNVSINGMKLAGKVILNQMTLTLQTSYVGDFQVRSLNSILSMVLRWVVIPKLNVKFAEGYPLPALGKMQLVNTQLRVLKDYILIGTDVQFAG